MQNLSDTTPPSLRIPNTQNKNLCNSTSKQKPILSFSCKQRYIEKNKIAPLIKPDQKTLVLFPISSVGCNTCILAIPITDIMSSVQNSNIKAFSVRFSSFKPRKSLPKSLSLHYYSRIQPDSTVFVTLHRVVNVEPGDALYTSTDRVRVNQGVHFAVYLDDERLMEGVLVKDEEKHVWKLESRFRRNGDVAEEVELSVALDDDVALTKRMEVMWRREEKNKGCYRGGFDKLQVIPEEGEETEDELNGGDCWAGGVEDDGSDGGDEFCGSEYLRMEMDLEGVRWAVDVGLWVMCLGVGFLVSRASAKSLKRSLIS